MVTNLINDPQHWRRRAEETRQMVGSMDDEKARATMLEVAEAYDRVADLAEKRTIGKDSETDK